MTTNKYCYFVSDIHFGHGNDNKKLNWFKQLSHEVVRNGSHLFLVGDIFDYWMEYHSVIPKRFFRILTLLQRISEAGVKLSYVSGNHDFALGRFFQDELNINVFPNMCEEIISGKKCLIMHGDKLFKPTILNKLLLNGICQQAYRMIHPDIGLALMKIMSQASRNRTSEIKQQRTIQITKTEAIRLAHEQHADIVVCGHSHFCEHLSLKNGKQYLNLGEWSSKAWYGTFNGEHTELKSIS